jgi:hypothetical protein
MRIKNKTFEAYKGKVYDLSVKDKNSYNVNGVAVHNSGAGSLVCYLTEITKVDPIKHGLLFERFLTRKKACLGVDSWVLCLDGPRQLKTLSVGDKVKTHTGIYSEIVAVDRTYDRTDWFEVSYGYRDVERPVLNLHGYKRQNYVCGKLTCSGNHKFVMVPNYKKDVKINPNRKHKTYDFVDAAEIFKEIHSSMQSVHYPRFYGVGSDNQTFETIDIKRGNGPLPLIDIRLKEDHTFWVADKKDGVYVLSHNSLPDIDCLLSTTLVQTASKEYKPISQLRVGDKVIGMNSKTEEVLAVQNRLSTASDMVYEVFIQINQTVGCIVATGKHRLFALNNNEILVDDLKIGDLIKSDCGKATVIKKTKLTETVELTDITTTTKSFNIAPFDVAENITSPHHYMVCGLNSCLQNNLTIVSHNSDCADREEAIKILTEHFGEENVLPVISYNQLKLKSLIKDLSRLYKIPFELINPLTQAIEQETLSKDKTAENFDRGVWVLTYESAIKNSPTFQQLMLDYPQLESSIKVLFKQDKSCFTADTLLLTNNGWKRFKNIKEDVDHVAYIDNVGEVQFNKDYFKVENGKKQVLKLVLDNGESLELTEDHLVETDNGWKEVKDLTVNDKLLGWI